MKRAAILMYHQVESSGPATRMCCPVAAFTAQMRWLKDSGRPLVNVGDVVAAASGERQLPDGAVAVSFDDGYDAFLEAALPVLQEFAIPSTVFAVVDRIGMDNDWIGEDSLPRRPLLNAPRLASLPSQGVTVGSHSLTHPRLTGLDDRALARELCESRERLAELFGFNVDLLAYPYGDYDDRVCEAARLAGYSGACSTRSGFNALGENPFALRRIDIYGTDSLHDFSRKLDLGVSRWSVGLEVRYLAGRLVGRLSGR